MLTPLFDVDNEVILDIGTRLGAAHAATLRVLAATAAAPRPAAAAAAGGTADVAIPAAPVSLLAPPQK